MAWRPKHPQGRRTSKMNFESAMVCLPEGRRLLLPIQNSDMNSALTLTANELISVPLTGARVVEKSSTSEPFAESAPLLTRKLAAGEERAFAEFHARYFDRLYQFLLVVTRGQEQEAQEALQQTLLRVARYARAFESEDAFWCWLKAVARSTARDAGRKQQRYWALLARFSLWRSNAPLEFPSAAAHIGKEQKGVLMELPVSA